MRVTEKDIPSPGPGQVLVRLRASGVNFIDVYHRRGLYRRKLPFVPGLEGSGEVRETGPDAGDFSVGDRVAYTGIAGSYAEYVVAPADRLIALPDSLDFRDGAAAMLQGMTAHYLAHSAYPLKPDDVCLVHAAAGGVGLLLIQMAKRRGARVFGTVSTEEKASIAKEAGADHIILYTEQDFQQETRRLTDGRGVNVVYDSVGKTTFEKSLDSLAPRGYLVLYGQASGPVPPVDLQILNQKGSLFITRPTLSHYTSDRKSLEKRSVDVLRWVASGELNLRIQHTFPLSEAAEAHRQLEGRQTTGKVLLIP